MAPVLSDKLRSALEVVKELEKIDSQIYNLTSNSDPLVDKFLNVSREEADRKYKYRKPPFAGAKKAAVILWAVVPVLFFFALIVAIGSEDFAAYAFLLFLSVIPIIPAVILTLRVIKVSSRNKALTSQRSDEAEELLLGIVNQYGSGEKLRELYDLRIELLYNDGESIYFLPDEAYNSIIVSKMIEKAEVLGLNDLVFVNDLCHLSKLEIELEILCSGEIGHNPLRVNDLNAKIFKVMEDIADKKRDKRSAGYTGVDAVFDAIFH